MTTNTEPLKVGEECREAFEQWMRDRFHILSSGLEINSDVGYYWDDSVQKRWEAWQASLHWNRRTDPSPAEVASTHAADMKRGIELTCFGGNDTTEVSSEGLPELPDDLKADIAGLCTAAIEGDPDGLCHSIHERIRAYTRQALSQQSPARVEGELTDEERAEIESIAYSVQECKLTPERAVIAIERALNQRLAVKEGEAVAYIYEHGDFAHYSGGIVYGRRFVQFERMTGFQTGYFGTCKDLKETPLYTHPAPDDQQAKDAARYRHLSRCVNNSRVAPISISEFNTVSWETIHSSDELDAAIDAALSTTKQEEV